MPNTAINFGRLLILLGVIGYAYGYFYSTPSWTALIPAIFGLVLLALGYLANAKENLRKHLMHVAVLVGLVGFILPIGRILSNISNFSLTFASVMLILMALLCLAFVALCVQSFINARRAS
jgi:energy-converting hydrogenase Eha subunit H